MSNFSTLGEVLSARDNSTHGINFIDGENAERRRPYRDFYRRAAGLLRHFQNAGATAGSEIVLLVDNNEQFIDAFWAGILGNIIVVPIAPGTNDEQRMKFFRVVSKLRAPCLCTDSRIHTRLSVFASENGMSKVIEKIRAGTIYLDQIEDVATPGNITAAKPDDIAFVQYSSGSTSEPKGVALTHRNLLTNIEGIISGIDLNERDACFSWMPLTHDMGLIGFHLTPLIADAEQHLMPTSLFVRRPQLWLTKATQHRATVLCSPNFGYRHFLKTFKAEASHSLDLSSVRIVFNGAEPISTSLCKEFNEQLSVFGLKASAMFPVYGLAEASLAVTFPAPGSGCATLSVRRTAINTGTSVERVTESSSDATTYALVGKPVAGCKLTIADEAQNPLPDFTVGHILIGGENVTNGYYLDSASTQALIKNGWLDTGDLGFNTPDGLAITGRAKEIIFVSGQNFYPQDIEAVLEKHAGLELGKVAVCGARADNEAADEVIAFVLHRGSETDFLPLVAKVKKVVNEIVGIPVNQVVPIARMPKTTSGKIQRFKLAASYLNGEFTQTLENLARLTASADASDDETHNEVERNLKEICDALLTGKVVGLHDNIFELGTSSLTLAQIYERIEAIYPGQLEVTDFFDYPTIAELAKYLQSKLQGA